jgi:tetratricopeptide (TPR) repeat protein
MPCWPIFGCAFSAVLLIFAAALSGQTGATQPTSSGSLRQHYIEAQDLQRARKLSEAADQYRAFLSEALGELAGGYGLAGDYVHAAPLFDEALALDPNSPSLILDYARTALLLGDPAHAKTLAANFIRNSRGDSAKLAQAHQLLGRALLKLNQDQEARREFEAAVALDPTFPNGYDLAVACLDLDDEKCAVQVFGEMEKSFGDSPELHMAFGRAYGDSDFQPRAITEFRRAIEENPRLPGAHYLLAAVLLATGDDENHVQAAQVELTKELAISPHDSQAYAALGKIAATHNNYAAAEKYLKRAVTLDPRSPDAWLYLGQIYFDTHRTAEAETALRECIRLTTDVSRNRYQVQKAHFLLGRILMQSGHQDAAHAEMQVSRDLANKTLSQDKDKLAGLMDSAGSTEQPGVAGAPAASPIAASVSDLPALRRVEAGRDQIKPAVADSYNNLGAIAATNNNYPDAVRYFEQAAAWNPSLEGLDYNWGRAAFAGSMFADAIPPLSRYLKGHSDDDGGRGVLGISQFMTGDYRGCIETLRPVVGKADLAPQVEYVYAQSMVMIGEVAAGTERLEKLEKSHPEIPDVHRAMGEALDRQGEKKRALDELRAAIQLNPRDADSRYELGKVTLESGDAAGAIQQLQAAAQLSPESEKFCQELAEAYKAALRPADAQTEIETCNELRARTQTGTSPHPAPAPER